MLGTLSHDSVKNGLVGGLAEAAAVAQILVLFKSRTQPFRAVVEGIAKRFVEALQCITLSHEDLDQCQTYANSSLDRIGLPVRKLLSMIEGEWQQRWVCKTSSSYDKGNTPLLIRSYWESNTHRYFPRGTDFIHANKYRQEEGSGVHRFFYLACVATHGFRQRPRTIRAGDRSLGRNWLQITVVKHVYIEDLLREDSAGDGRLPRRTSDRPHADT